MAAELFRKSALERLTSPEQLDRLVAVACPKTWLALSMLGMMAAAAVVWSVLGRLPTLVTGQGLLISGGGQIASIQAPAAGTLTTLEIGVGDHVEIGQVVARLSQTDAEQRLRNAEAALRERIDDQARIESQVAQEQAVKRDNLDLRHRALRELLESSQQRSAFLRDQLRDEESLVARKIITRDMVARTRDETNRAEHNVAEVRNDSAQLDAEELDLAATLDNRLRAARDTVSEARRQIEQIRAVLSESVVVVSPASGEVTELKVAPGALVAQGQSLCALQSGVQDLQLLFYVPPQQGKRIRPGMEVRISPATARREEFGTLQGEVEWVSEFPASPEGMRAVLHNDELIRTFSQAGPPYVARVRLLRDPDSISGYRWSSTKGALLPLSSGTLASAEITVAEQAPVTLILPLLREYTGFF
jgi:HlyD family secretion protein